MSARRALVVCPGRGSYSRDNLRSLDGLDSPSLDRLDALRRAWGRPTPRELDAEPAFQSRLHVAGENASILTAAITLADLDQLDPERVEVCCVVGNSMGWYTALGYAGALPLDDCATLIETLGQYQIANVIGGQVVYPLVDDEWRIDPRRAEGVESVIDRVNDLHWSIRLGGQAVLGGSERALEAFGASVQPLQLGPNRFPLRLPLHSAFHTPLMARTSARAFEELSGLGWQAPRVPMVDGAGRVWRPRHADPGALRDYTLGEQIVAPFDFQAAVRVAMREYAPDLIVLPGPGTNLGGAIAQSLIAEGWQGLDSRTAFLARQEKSPVLASMRWPGQRNLVTR